MERVLKGKKIILVEYPSDFKIENLDKKKLSFPFKSKLQFKNSGHCLEMKPLSTRIKKKYKNQIRILSKNKNGKYTVVRKKFDDVLKITKAISKKRTA
jgi:thiol-disulfide isomerase/thioredoxin